MFGTLLESSARHRRRSRVAVVSIVAHAVAITLASAATRTVHVRPAPEPRDLTILYHPPAPLPPVAAPPGGRTGGVVGRRTPPPVDAPPSLPPIGPVAIDPVGLAATGPATTTSTFARPERESGGGPVAAPDGVFRVVERAAAALPGAPIARYPESLRQAGLEGEVVLRFVVDTAGRVEAGSATTVRATHPLFDAAVRRALSATRYAPAEVGGRRVRQLVEQAFTFAIHE
jgi:periplasmic protein TonB